MAEPNPKRVKAYEAGLAAETLVKDSLAAKGFETLFERYKTKGGEIDLIVCRGDLICFVEVKARSSIEDGLRSVTPKAQQRLANAATQWMADHPELIAHISTFRFDVAVVTPDAHITIVENAFMTDG